MSQETTGYELPAGDAFEDELCCAIVYYPDREEYRRALLGALTYFATWIAWERDAAKRGQDAAASWQLALDKTLECWNMACMEDLIAIQQDILTLLQSKKDCCDTGVTYGPQETVETDITPGVGPPPTLYGETAVVDWDDWEEHVCHNAHIYVDNLIAAAEELVLAVEGAWVVVGLVASLMILATMSGIGIPIAFGLAASVTGALAILTSGAVFTDAAEDLETARDDIVCALTQDTDLATAVETALSSSIAWDTFYQFLDYATARSLIYEGGHDGEYLPSDTRDDCLCPVGPEPEGQIWGIAWTVTNLKLDDANSSNLRYRNSATGERGVNSNATREYGYASNIGPPDFTIVFCQNDQLTTFPYAYDTSYLNMKEYDDRAADEKSLWGIAVYKNTGGTGNVKAYQKDIYVNYATDRYDPGAWYKCKLTFNAAKSTVSGATVVADGEEIDINGTVSGTQSNTWWFFDVVGYGDPLT